MRDLHPCGVCRTPTARFISVCIKDGDEVAFAACVAVCDLHAVEAVNVFRQPTLDAQAVSLALPHADDPACAPIAPEPVVLGEILQIRDGCIDQAEISYETHRRGKNWIATVVADKTQKGGLRRDFWTKTTTSWRRIPGNLQIGDVLEVAAEYVTGSGRNDKARVYRRVRTVGGGILTLEKVSKPD